MEKRETPSIDTVREVLREQEDTTRPEPAPPAQEDDQSDKEDSEQGS